MRGKTQINKIGSKKGEITTNTKGIIRTTLKTHFQEIGKSRRDG
jgi:hypothetical protein